ncbi:MAG: DUF5678 domain-containing protein [Bryobacteraceae bacterium]|jgi:hypothetical protein
MASQLEVVYDREGIGRTHFVVLGPLKPFSFAERRHLAVIVTDELRPDLAFSTRDREQEWLRLNGPRYAGQWVAIEGNRLVSHGDNARVVLQQARTNGVEHPLVIQIPTDPPLPFGGW